MDIRTERLNEAFRNSGLTQSELCAKTGINKGSLSSWLVGRYYPKQVGLEKLSKALNVSINYLMGFDIDSANASDSSTESRLLEMFRELNSDGQEDALGYIRKLLYVPEYKKLNQLDKVSEG